MIQYRGAAMKRLTVLLTLLPCLLCACATTDVLNTYERDELIAVQHNTTNDYTLLIYRDPLGQRRHVLRRHGVFELALTYTLNGEVALRERGCPPRVLEAIEAHRVTRHINDMLQVHKEAPERLSSI